MFELGLEKCVNSLLGSAQLLIYKLNVSDNAFMPSMAHAEENSLIRGADLEELHVRSKKIPRPTGDLQTRVVLPMQEEVVICPLLEHHHGRKPRVGETVLLHWTLRR